MKFTDKESYSLPVVLALGLHVAVLVGGALLAGFSEKAPEPPKRPPIVNATIIDVSETVIGKREAEERRAAEAAVKAQQEAKRKAQEEAQRKAERAALEKQRREAEATRRQQEQARQKAEAERQAALEKKKAAEEKARQERIAKEKKAAQEKARQERIAKEKKAAEEKAKQAAERKRQQELERQRAAEAERKRKAEEQARQEAERRKRAEEAVQRAVAEEDARRRAAEAGQMVQSISGLINRRVTDAWIRPPSARNGMQTLLRINFLPNGEVADVRVLKGSGDAVFDKRAMDAVYKVGRIEELSEVESYIFERNFRQVDLLFNPQDLRN
ncbi:hypothetical protein MAQ5080_02101 [Marinomonas aquimarina]|uniref:Cell envelope integrity inner membrane protein TolA n=1 Tax=Marinomonas aquimarina TaxID=295068 RepID=A0A1A8TIC2_9GAMM|nr:cell envelope integrity protein TolA [Marinomonas aquimarina]SBS31893.1 hypothetical protein MAQ5080_02101 [Marinomonas aquimarina]